MTCHDFCFEGANAQTEPKSTCEEAYVGGEKFHCDYKRYCHYLQYLCICINCAYSHYSVETIKI